MRGCVFRAGVVLEAPSPSSDVRRGRGCPGRAKCVPGRASVATCRCPTVAPRAEDAPTFMRADARARGQCRRAPSCHCVGQLGGRDARRTDRIPSYDAGRPSRAWPDAPSAALGLHNAVCAGGRRTLISLCHRAARPVTLSRVPHAFLDEHHPRHLLRVLRAKARYPPYTIVVGRQVPCTHVRSLSVRCIRLQAVRYFSWAQRARRVCARCERRAGLTQ
ncbi:hypothetical protein C8Q78DRAFT_63530 [Trametes maxima]|nr:hypothetical protein C8Q78DRAFT_63530 [Trametes maxima]